MNRVSPAHRRPSVRTGRARLRPLVVLGLGTMFVIGPVAGAAAESSAEDPTIVFSATGTTPLRCGTRPNYTAMQVKTGTKVILANTTDVAARAEVAGEVVATLEPGTGLLIKLKKGQHDVRLVPDCVVISEAEVVTISVVTGSEVGEPVVEPSPEPRTDGSAGVGATATDPPPSVTGPASESSVGANSSAAAQPPTGGPTPTARSSGGSVPVAATHRSSSPPASGGTRESAVIDVRAVEIGPLIDPKTDRLLAVIAAICVFGVTAAIIRAIVSQRTSSAQPL